MTSDSERAARERNTQRIRVVLQAQFGPITWDTWGGDCKGKLVFLMRTWNVLTKGKRMLGPG